MKLAKSFHRLDKMADEDMFSELPFPSYPMKTLLGPMFALRVRVLLLKEGDKIRFATCLLIFPPHHQKSVMSEFKVGSKVQRSRSVFSFNAPPSPVQAGGDMKAFKVFLATCSLVRD